MTPHRQRVQGRLQPRVVATEGARKLEEDGAELRRPGERLDPLGEAHEPVADPGQPLHVGEVAARLDREDEVRRRLLDPRGDRPASGQAVERGVNLDRVEERA